MTTAKPAHAFRKARFYSLLTVAAAALLCPLLTLLSLIGSETVSFILYYTVEGLDFLILAFVFSAAFSFTERRVCPSVFALPFLLLLPLFVFECLEFNLSNLLIGETSLVTLLYGALPALLFYLLRAAFVAVLCLFALLLRRLLKNGPLSEKPEDIRCGNLRSLPFLILAIGIFALFFVGFTSDLAEAISFLAEHAESFSPTEVLSITADLVLDLVWFVLALPIGTFLLKKGEKIAKSLS